MHRPLPTRVEITQSRAGDVLAAAANILRSTGGTSQPMALLGRSRDLVGAHKASHAAICCKPVRKQHFGLAGSLVVPAT